jgi:DNA modification methylase
MKTKPKPRRAAGALGIVPQEYEMVPVGALQPNEWNANQGDLGSIIESVQVNQFYGAILAQKSTGRIIAGEHRWRAAQSEGLQTVPVIYLDVDDEAAKRIMLADNRTSRLGMDDPAALAELLQGMPSLEGTGFDSDALQELLEDLGQAGPAGQTDEDDAPESPVAPVTVLGDLWALGEHRVLCGDSTSVDAVARLCGATLAGLLVTDPPYGVCYADKNRFLNSISRGNRIQVPIEGDHQKPEEMAEFWVEAFTTARTALRDGAAYYVTGPQGGVLLLLLLQSLAQSGFPLRHMLIWAKNNHVLGRADYNYKHEPIIYGWTDGGTHKFYGPLSETSLWEIDKPLKSDLHPTMKPVKLFERAINNSSQAGEIVLDPFLGSGTSVIACEKTNRICYGLELAPEYVDVIVRRWQDFTGKEAVLADGPYKGSTFAQAKAGRLAQACDEIMEEAIVAMDARRHSPPPPKRASSRTTEG